MRERSILLTSLLAVIAMASPVGTAAGAVDSEELVPVIITLADQPELPNTAGLAKAQRNQRVVGSLRAHAARTQGPLIGFLNQRRGGGAVADIQPFWIFNGIAASVAPAVVAELEARDDVASVASDRVIAISPAAAGDSPGEPNIDLVNAPAMWALGYTGAGVVVANMDSGVDVAHPDLNGSYRGGSNSWFDPHGEHPNGPIDLDGHGTATMGLMVGGDAGGTAIGMAPDATWIAVKAFDDTGNTTTSALHAGYQWLLDPDGNPATADAPDVVNNSWTFSAPGCYLDHQPDLQALRAAGIVPVFAAGNYGPGASSSRSPGNNPEAFAVGATDNADAIASFSGRGPSPCGGDTLTPDIVAPGVGTRSADRFGLYNSPDGTSFSAPHVSGALALLLSADSGLSVGSQEAALIGGAVDLGAAGPDAVYGHGRLDVLASHTWLVNNPNQDPTASFTVSKRKGKHNFDGSGSSDPDGTIVAYEWDFGDGATATGVTATHKYSSGTYTAVLTITDNSGATASTSEQIDAGGGGGGGKGGGGKPPKGPR